MPKHDKIQHEELRKRVDEAYKYMRAGNGSDAVRVLASSFLLLIELKPELLALPGTGPRMMPLLMRWPRLGANITFESMRSGKPQLEFVRDTFAVSEAMMYYEFTVETALSSGVREVP